MDDQEHPGSDPSTQLTGKGAARRRFAKSGSALSGVVLTMTSRHGIAGVVRGGCPSGFSSTTNSRAPTTDSSGRSPGYWKNKGCDTIHKVFVGAGTSTDAKFGSVFGKARNTTMYNASLLTVLSGTYSQKGVDPDNVAMHIVAALLNARAHLTPNLLEPKVREIWNGYLLGGFVPTTGARPWNGCQIVLYLKSTFSRADVPDSALDPKQCGY